MSVQTTSIRAGAVPVVAANMDTTDYLAMYLFGGHDCSNSDSVLLAYAFDMGRCTDVEENGQKYSFELVCANDMFSVAGYLGNGCKDSPAMFQTLLNSTVMNQCSMSGDLFMYPQCTNQLDYGFDTSPAIGFYTGSECDESRIGAMYVKEQECVSTPTLSYSSSCGHDLELTFYNGTDCSGMGGYMSTRTDKCLDQTDFPGPFNNDDDADDDDDDYDDDYDDDDGDDDGPFAVSTYYAVCNAQDLPSSAFRQVASWWSGALIALVFAFLRA